MNDQIEEQAIVIGIEGDHALLEIERRHPCGVCGKTKGCGVSIVGKAFKHDQGVFRARNEIGVKVGQRVAVGLHPDALLRNAFMLYGVPLCAVLLGAFLGQQFGATALETSFSSDVSAMLGALFGFASSALWLKIHSSGQVARYAYFQPQILRVLEQTILPISCERSQ